jgi:hypothetical protein
MYSEGFQNSLQIINHSEIDILAHPEIIGLISEFAAALE